MPSLSFRNSCSPRSSEISFLTVTEPFLSVKPKETENPALAPYFAWRREISCIRTEPVSEDIFGRGLAERAGKLFEALVPVYDYFGQF